GYQPLIKGEVYYECGDFSKAVPDLAAAVEEATQAGCPGALVPAMVTIAKIKRACGNLTGALEMVEQCEKTVAAYHKSHWVYMLEAFKTRLCIDADNTEAVDRWMTQSKLGVYHEITRTREFELIVFARALIKKQRYQDADILLNRLLSVSEGLRRNHSIVEILNLLAITAMKNLNEDDAFFYIERSLSVGMEGGYVRSFADELSPMVSLLELFIRKNKKRNKQTKYARNLLIKTQKAARDYMYSAHFPKTESTLTTTEKKVLQLIVKGYTNREIADELCIAIRTATNHTVSIYRKMGVKNRTQCAQKAREYP
ncbi:MAG: LuxR C-terminal-related transcriptional regulator, partial [Syntrophomonas sp.]